MSANQPPPGGPFGTPEPPPFGAGDGGSAEPLQGMPPLASSGRRLVARIIDALVVSIPVLLILWGTIGFNTSSTRQSWDESAVVAVVYLIYEGLMFSRDGQTLGKKWMNIRVAMLADGSAPTKAAAWLRAATYVVLAWICCVFWLINVVWHLWDRPYRQCVHDKVARTVVVRAE